MNRLVSDTNGLVEAASQGHLNRRADPARHEGDFARVVDGVNRTLDVVTAPINEATAVLEKLADKDLRARMAGNYQGDHDRIKQAINATGDALEEALGPGVPHGLGQVTGSRHPNRLFLPGGGLRRLPAGELPRGVAEFHGVGPRA